MLERQKKYFVRDNHYLVYRKKKDSEVLCKLGLERKLNNWHMPTKIMRDLKFLSRVPFVVIFLSQID